MILNFIKVIQLKVVFVKDVVGELMHIKVI